MLFLVRKLIHFVIDIVISMLRPNNVKLMVNYLHFILFFSCTQSHTFYSYDLKYLYFCLWAKCIYMKITTDTSCQLINSVRWAYGRSKRLAFEFIWKNKIDLCNIKCFLYWSVKGVGKSFLLPCFITSSVPVDNAVGPWTVWD